MPVLHLNDGNFDQEVLKSNIPILVDFWAAWCGPCRMVGPILEELAVEYDGKIKIAKVDVDANPQKSAEYEIRSIPNLIIFKDGKIADNMLGGLPKAEIAKHINAVIGK
jgi:thioredoxin 1